MVKLYKYKIFLLKNLFLYKRFNITLFAFDTMIINLFFFFLITFIIVGTSFSAR